MKRAMKRKAMMAGLALGGIPLITTATCDPYYGYFDFFRDDDAGYYDPYYYGGGYYYEEYVVYDDCFFGCW